MRLAPDLPFPPYAHEPGKTPHPSRSPKGHSYGRPEPEVAPLDPTNPYASVEYLFGFDLFNHGYFWEAHEQWEGLWHAHGRKGDVADLLKALIRFAAAGVKAKAGVAGGTRSHARAAAELLDGLRVGRGSEFLAGLHLRLVASYARETAAHAEDGKPHPKLERGTFVWSVYPEPVGW